MEHKEKEAYQAPQVTEHEPLVDITGITYPALGPPERSRLP